MINLDSQQQAAVFTSSKKALVLAGAGSGKTRVVVERIRHLLKDKKVSPYEILALTFTRKAAEELRTRIDTPYITIGTIHAIALNLLHRFGDLVGMKARNITVYGGFEEEFLIKEIAIDLGIFKGKTWKFPKKEILSMLNTYYAKGEEPKEDHPGYVLFKELMTRCRENNSMTYGMLLTAMMELVPKIKQYLKWKYVFLDEAQDTDPLQWWIVEEFPKLLGASLFAVGDIDQSIYKFRGAVPEYLVSQQDQFDIYRLENNYRSVPEIVEASNRLIEHNTERIPKTMRATRGSGVMEAIEIVPNADCLTIANLVGSFSDCDYGHIVVLSRIHKLLEKLSEELTNLGIPHVKIGRKTALVESEPFRRFHALLKLLVNPYDNFSFLLIRDLIGVPRETYNQIRLEATQLSKSHFQVWRNIDRDSIYCAFYDSIDQWCFDEIIVNLCSSEFAWPFDIQPIKAFVLDWCQKDGRAVNDYLEWLATWDIQEELTEEKEDKVKLMTIHAAKGLEFPVVIVAGCNEGILPSNHAINSGDVEEERRLFYVACTRAKDNLIITERPEETIDQRGMVHKNPVSRFIKEMEA